MLSFNSIESFDFYFEVYSVSHESLSSTSYSIDQPMQTQLDAPQQIVTEPPVLNLSGTNVLDPIDILQSVSISPNLTLTTIDVNTNSLKICLFTSIVVSVSFGDK